MLAGYLIWCVCIACTVVGQSAVNPVTNTSDGQPFHTISTTASFDGLPLNTMSTTASSDGQPTTSTTATASSDGQPLNTTSTTASTLLTGFRDATFSTTASSTLVGFMISPPISTIHTSSRSKHLSVVTNESDSVPAMTSEIAAPTASGDSVTVNSRSSVATQSIESTLNYTPVMTSEIIAATITSDNTPVRYTPASISLILEVTADYSTGGEALTPSTTLGLSHLGIVTQKTLPQSTVTATPIDSVLYRTLTVSKVRIVGSSTNRLSTTTQLGSTSATISASSTVPSVLSQTSTASFRHHSTDDLMFNTPSKISSINLVSTISTASAASLPHRNTDALVSITLSEVSRMPSITPVNTIPTTSSLHHGTGDLMSTSPSKTLDITPAPSTDYGNLKFAVGLIGSVVVLLTSAVLVVMVVGMGVQCREWRKGRKSFEIRIPNRGSDLFRYTSHSNK